MLVQVLLLGRLHHRNLVNLIGYCVDKGQRILVYQFMSNGSLANLLYGKRMIFHVIILRYFYSDSCVSRVAWLCHQIDRQIILYLHLFSSHIIIIVSIDNSLWIHLGEEKHLSWDERLQIALDISHGIEYLHEGVCVITDTCSLTLWKCIWLIWICM